MRTHKLGIAVQLALLFVPGFFACVITGTEPAQLVRRADAEIARGDSAAAIRSLERAVASEEMAAERYMQLGALYRSRHSITARHQSAEVLQNGLRRFPDHPGLLLELGKTRYGQTFYPDAARCFARVLEQLPDHCEAHFYLGLNSFRKWKHVQVYKEYLEDAARHFVHVIDCDPSNKVAYFKLVLSVYATGDTARAEDRVSGFISRNPDAPEGHFLRGAIAYQRDDYETCTNSFDVGFSLLPEEEQSNLRDISLLLSEDEFWDYESASSEKRKELERIFWAQRDPDLTTDLNERYLEHIQRMFLADTFFNHARPRLRGWESERGKALVKFGWPDEVDTTLEGETLSGRMEIWSYDNEFVALTLFFRDEFLNGNYIVPMDYRFSSSAQSLYLDPPASHYVSPCVAIPGIMDVLAFRDGSGGTDVYLALKVDVKSLAEQIEASNTDRFFMRTAFFDDAWNRHSYTADTLGSDLVSRPARDWYYMSRGFELSFDFHRIALCLEDENAETRMLLTADTNTSEYLSDSLLISDILLHQHDREEDATGAITRHGRSFFPNPGGLYDKAEKLRLYFEVYNLDVRRARSEYEITYSIFEAGQERKDRWSRIKRGLKNLAGFRTPPDPVISQTLERRATGHDAEEDLTIDIDALRPGHYALQVAVRDRTSGQTAVRTRLFSRENGQSAAE